MHYKAVALAATAAGLLSTVVADQARPKIYFPRHVKRQFINATITSNGPIPEESTTSTSSTRRQSLDDLLSSIKDDLGIGKPSDTPTPPTEDEGDGAVTTIVISSTIVVAPPTDAPSTEAVASTGGLPVTIVLPIDTATDEPSPTPAETDTESSTEGTSSEITIAPTGIVRPTSNFLTEILPTFLLPVPSSDVETATGVTESSTAIETATEVIEPTPTTTPGGLLDPIISIITSILPTIPSSIVIIDPPIINATASDVLPTELPTDLPTILPTDLPTILPTDIPTTILPTDTPIVSDPPLPTSTDSPPDPVTTTFSEPQPTSPPGTDLPETTPTDIPINPNTTSTVVEPPPPPPTSSLGNTTFPDPTPSPSPTATEDDLPQGPSTPMTSLLPTGTITDSAEPWLPTTILVEQSSAIATPTDPFAPTTTIALPSNLPGAISPQDPSQLEQPNDTTLLQIGFNKGENYQFVADNPKAVAQIFELLPQALAFAGSFDIERVKMTRLEPYNTQRTLGYITTLAKFYYPNSMVEGLRVDIKIASSALYNHPEELVFNLTRHINPTIDIISVLDEEGEDGPGGGPGNGQPPNGDPFVQPPGEQSPMQQGTAAAIGLGAVGVAAAYGAAMFIIARRYKQKKMAHRRASSTVGSSEMRYTGTGSPALMGGALLSRDFSSYGVAGGRHSHGSGQSGRSGMGNSGRTAYISAPVAAENSLGWN